MARRNLFSPYSLDCRHLLIVQSCDATQVDKFYPSEDELRDVIYHQLQHLLRLPVPSPLALSDVAVSGRYQPHSAQP